MSNTLSNLSELVKELNTTNSSNEKKEILAKYPQCKDILYYTYNPFYQFYITSDVLKKRTDLIEKVKDLGIFEMFDLLSNREITGHKAISVVNGFIDENKEYSELIYNIIDKNLETRTNTSLINKVFKDLIPEFNVALANKYNDFIDKVDFDKDDWYASRKLDGVRCIAVVKKDGIKFYSRKGKEFYTLDIVKTELEGYILPHTDYILDGEICLIDKEDNDDFQGIMKEIRKKDHTIPNPRYKVFDLLSNKEFYNAESSVDFSSRIKGLKDFFMKSSIVQPVDQIIVRDDDHLAEMTKEASDKGWEGLILRKDTHYKGKRSNDLLKVKKMHDAEYTVVGVEFGNIRYIKDGVDTEEEMLSNVIIEHKGNCVSVGSGFTQEERQYYYKHPEEISGKIILVSYFEETTNQNGDHSLRFPVFKHIYGDRREV